jgi:hypothetical protein
MRSHNSEITYILPLVIFFQYAIFLLPLLCMGYIYTNNIHNIFLCFIYPLVVAGWILMLGNGKLAMNIDECKYITRISHSKFKKIIYITSSKDEVLSTVDYWYQISGYFSIVLGLLLSTIVFLLQKKAGISSNWMSLSDIYTSIIIIYSLAIVLLSTGIRVYFYIIELKWYKKNRK